jgi:hypothetical protein
MPFQKDEWIETEYGKVYGDYLTTFVSEPTGQVHAYLFQNGKRIDVHISFSKGIDVSTVKEPYATPLWEYAHNAGVSDRFHFIFSS